MDEFIDIDTSSCIFYHSLCDLNHNEIRPNSNEKILARKNVKLLTLNIFLRPPPIKNNENDWKDERLEDFCKIIHEYDIICLQEMFGAFNSRKQSLIRAATKSGFFFYVDTSSPSFLSKYMVDGGLMILSRFPIVSFSFTQYRYGVIADSLAQKGLLYAKVLIKDSFLHLFTTHLQASYLDSGESHFKVSCETRMAQMKQINHMMNDVLKSQYHKRDKIILCGDFNVDAQKYKYKKPSGLTENNICCIEKEYDDMMECLNCEKLHARDVFLYYKNYNPITYGDKDSGTGYMESCITHIEDQGSRQSLDYIFECFYDDEVKILREIQDTKNEKGRENGGNISSSDIGSQNLVDNGVKDKDYNFKIPNSHLKRLKIDPDSLKVEKLHLASLFPHEVNNFSINKKYTQISDHYGLSCEIIHTPCREEEIEERTDSDNNYNIDDRINEEQRNLLDNI